MHLHCIVVDLHKEVLCPVLSVCDISKQSTRVKSVMRRAE